MRLLSIFLIFSLLVPFLPSSASAQLVVNPLNDSPGGGLISSPLSVQQFGNFSQGVVWDGYKLGSGDRLEAHLIVGDNALVLDYIFVINPEGKIFFPNVAEIYLSGLTLKQARAKLIKEIKKKYREDFSLSLMVSNLKTISVYVTGQVNNTGLKPVSDGTRIASVLKDVGVAKGGSDLSEYIYLKRQTSGGDFKDYKLSLYSIFLGDDDTQNMLLKNGDIISVPVIKSYVYVYGDVARSGTFGYVPGQTLSDYINIAGGPTPRANLSGVTVTRQEKGKPKVYHINASDIIQRGLMGKDIEIYAGDVISIPGNFFYFSDFASFANTILLALTLYTAFAK